MGGSDMSPWPALLAQVPALAAQLVELQAPRLRVDVDGRAVGYRSLEGLDPEQYAPLLREMLESLARTYPQPEGPVRLIGLWPGCWPEQTRNEVLESWETVVI